MAKKKVNPKKVTGFTLADVEKATAEATTNSLRLSLAIMLTVLCDDFGFDDGQIKKVWERVEKLSSEVAEHRINTKDLVGVLEEEYNIILS